MTKRFAPTHEITLTDKRTGERRSFPVALVDGLAYTRQQWEADEKAEWKFHPVDGWVFWGKPSPAYHLEVSVKKLKPGRQSRTGAAANERITFRATKPEVKRWQEAAAREGLSISDWLRAAAELAIARGATR